MSASQKEPLEFTLSGRLRNLSLAPSQENSLVPVFEAITNAIHAIEDRFGPVNASKGEADIQCLYDENDEIIGYRISDNGIGLTPDNYSSFKRSDSDRKLKRGGKGVGRLTWLKVFEKIKISSTYLDGVAANNISFDFLYDEVAPIQNKNSGPAEQHHRIGTIIELSPFRSEYKSRAPKKDETIAKEIVRHFLSFIVSETAPKISFTGTGGRIDLSDFYRSKIVRQFQEEIVIVDEGGVEHKVLLRHMLIDKALRDSEKGTNLLFLCAHKRAVKRHVLDNQIGMEIIDGQYIYLGIIESDILDNSVNQERTNFSLDQTDINAIVKSCIIAAKAFLKDEIALVRKHQRQNVEIIAKQNPRFLTILGNVDEFVNDKLALSQKSQEEIFLELTREHHREYARRTKDIVESRKKKDEIDIVDEKHRAFLSFATKDTANTLAEYVVRRRAILEALSVVHGYQDEDKRKHYLEKAIHEYICPLGSTSDDLPYDRHNLWIIDDRLAYYNYFNSDKKINTITVDGDSKKEPDISFFDLGLGFRRERTMEPVVIVEFKRPGRKDYASDNPLLQVLEYVADIKEGRAAQDKNGRVISSITKDTPFICYIVADLNRALKNALFGTVVNRPTPDGQGMYGYYEDLRAFIEVIPYEKIFSDARARNEVFFEKLGLPTNISS